MTQTPRLLLLETSTALCSAALSEGERILAYREAEGRNVHAAMAAVLVKELLDEAGWTVADCDAVCVGKGPGSYTGLRVGVSTAKGLCFGAGKPLIGVGTLDALVAQAAAEGQIPEGCGAVVPMIDARRMEVYSAVFSPEGQQRTETVPTVVGEDSFADLFTAGSPVLFIGDGAGKCTPLLGRHPEARFVEACPKASSLLRPALAAWHEKRFEDVAYFEPFYLKDFIATVSRKNLF